MGRELIDTPIPTIAAELGEPDACPVCGMNWKGGACRHVSMVAEELPIGDQVRLYRKLRGRDAPAELLLRKTEAQSALIEDLRAQLGAAVMVLVKALEQCGLQEVRIPREALMAMERGKVTLEHYRDIRTDEEVFRVVRSEE